MSRRARVKRLEEASGGDAWVVGPVIVLADGMLRLPDGRIVTREDLERERPNMGFIMLPEVAGVETF